jgi:DNA-binding response OmpR family regulator
MEQENQPTIFLIEEDDETRRPLVRNLRSYGYHVIVAVDEEEALERADGGGVAADLLLVNLVLKTAEQSLGVGRRVREHVEGDGHTPLVVMPEKYGKDVEGTNVNAGGNDWVLYLGEEPGQLEGLLASLLKREVPEGEGRRGLENNS